MRSLIAKGEDTGSQQTHKPMGAVRSEQRHTSFRVTTQKPFWNSTMYVSL